MSSENTKNDTINVDKDDINNRGFGANLYPEFCRPINEANINNPPGAIEMTSYPEKKGEGKVCNNNNNNNIKKKINK